LTTPQPPTRSRVTGYHLIPLDTTPVISRPGGTDGAYRVDQCSWGTSSHTYNIVRGVRQHYTPWPTYCTPWPTYYTPWPTYCTPWPTYYTPWPTYYTPWPTYCTPWLTYCTPWLTYYTPWPTYYTPWPTYYTPLADLLHTLADSNAYGFSFGFMTTYSFSQALFSDRHWPLL
jgi:hypothetical protein